MSSEANVPAGNVAGENISPVALASHDDVVKDPALFWDTLQKFRAALGTKCPKPVVGGQQLDLHVLYVEVTKRGGYDKVVDGKKWREISCLFDFPPKTTSASYVLNKHYKLLLKDYEKAYFFRLPVLRSAPRTGPPTFNAIGTIDAKFEFGYLVSVKLGSETLNGFLYHPSDPNTSKALHVNTCTAIVPYIPQAPQKSGRRGRKRRAGDPSRPKPNRSGYNFFFAEKHSALKSLYPNREREFTKMIGESWSNLSPEDRMVYQNYGLKDKERYQRELKEYKERLQNGDRH